MASRLADVQLPPSEILRLLADGEIHSGEELAGVMGVSRTAIWKQLAKLEVLGLALVSQPGKGYRLVGGLELLDKASIFAGLVPEVHASITQMNILTTVDSTNAFLLRQEPALGVSVCFAELQTAGRGRRGRQWVSPFATNIYLSLKFTVDLGIGVVEGLSLAVGVAVARALKELGVEDVQLKWPNDVLWCGRKLGGILIEIVGDPFGFCYVVVGLGLNLKSVHSMQASISQPWVALDEVLLHSPARNTTAASLLNHIIPVLNDYTLGAFSLYKDEWESLNIHQHLPVKLLLGDRVVEGDMKGVNAAGALLLQTSSGLEVFHGGEVSLREAT